MMRFGKHYFIATLIILITIPTIMYLKHDFLSRFLTLKFKPNTYLDENVSVGLNYRLFVPKSGDEKKPLLLILHSRAQRGQDNFRQLDRVAFYFSKNAVQKEHPMFILAPQVPPGNDWVKYENDGCHPCRQYHPCIHYNQENTEEKEEITLTISLIKKLAQQYAIDMNRIYITGFSMGGTGVWDVITRYPDFFAAATPMSGSSDTSKAYLLKDMPIWAFSGGNDELYGTRLNENMVEKVNFYGGTAKHSIFPGVGHNCKREALKVLRENNWPYTILKKP